MCKFNNFSTIRLSFIIFLCLLISSCAFGKKTPRISSELRKPAIDLSQEIALFEQTPSSDYYTIGEEDVLEIGVWKSLGLQEAEAGKEKVKEYLIARGDTLDISVWQWPDLARSAIVRPDGKISFPLVGDIDAEGKTLTELDDEITQKLSAYIKSPEVSVMITAFGMAATGAAPEISFIKIEELSAKEVVAPDGNIYLPLAGAVRASGLTLNQLRHRVKEKVADYVKNPEVSVTIKTFGGKKVIVLGEVNDPGVYRPTSKTSVLELISLAGGYTDDAVLKSVMLIRGSLDNPEVKVLDINAVIKKGDVSQNLEVKPQDIVYVPKTIISDVNYFLTQLLGPLTSSSSAVGAIRAVRIGPSPKK
jgi:polysaccharide export outer membrane protein